MIGVRNIIPEREGEIMAKKVRVNAYTKPTTGQNVRGYVREDPRASGKGAPHELPPEDDKPSFLSGGIEEDKESEEEAKERD